MNLKRTEEKWIDIKTISEIKGITSRALRISLAKGKYISRKVSTQGGKSYEILLSSLEDDVQQRFKSSVDCFDESSSLPTETISPFQDSRFLFHKNLSYKDTSEQQIDASFID